MTNTASRRIRGRRGAERPKPPEEEFISEEAGGFFWKAIILSAVIHAAVLGIIWHQPARKITKAIEIFNVTVTTLPGPAGGGGKSLEQVKKPEPQVKEPPKEQVRLAKKEVEKKPPEPQKKPEPQKPEVAKIHPPAPQGPGQGPMGGGGKAKPGAIVGPVAIEGNFDPKYAWYADMIRKAVERQWNPMSFWGRVAKPAIISFVIDSGGNITDVKIETTSGMDTYDQKALIAVKRVRKLQPPPAGLGDALGVHYSFIQEKQG